MRLLRVAVPTREQDKDDNRTVSNAGLIAIVGPTAAGKSAVAMDLGLRFGAEIVNADAFCLYRGMDIGTAKPSVADRQSVPHHLIDTHEVEDDVDVATYQRLARDAIDDIQARGRIALLVGGSGLYVQAVLDDLRFPGTDPVVRAELEAELASVGPRELHARLTRVDPAAAAVILPSNGRRIVRALEVNALGQPFQATLGGRGPWRASLRIGWDPGVDAVDAAIETRVHDMWQAGFVQEVQGLAGRMGRTASAAVGYRQILDDPATAMESIIVATRRLARRQRRWFHRDPQIQWAESSSRLAEILGRLEV